MILIIRLMIRIRIMENLTTLLTVQKIPRILKAKKKKEEAYASIATALNIK